MNVTKIELGTITALVVAIVAGAVQFGQLQGQIDGLNPDAIRQQRDGALRQIEGARDQAIEKVHTASNLTRRYFDREWCEVGDHRRPGPTYKNEGVLPIEIAISARQGGAGSETNRCNIEVFVDDARVLWMQNNFDQWSRYCAVVVTVPPGSEYRIAPRGHKTEVVLVSWYELRADCTH